MNVTHEEHKIAAAEAWADFVAADGENETEAQAIARFRQKALCWFGLGREMRLLPFETGAIERAMFVRVRDAVVAAKTPTAIDAAFRI